MSRKYSLGEINQMREAISFLGGSLQFGPHMCSGQPLGAEETELQLQTHMLNGTTGSELYEERERVMREGMALAARHETIEEATK